VVQQQVDHESGNDESKLSRSGSAQDSKGATKIISFNVNGLRAAMKKGFVDYVLSNNPDVVCLSEIKGTEDDFGLKIDGYNLHFNSSTSKAGYAGTAIFIKCDFERKHSVKITNDLGEQELDGEGRVMTCEFPSFFLVNTYVVNAGQALERLSFRTEKWDPKLLAYLNKLQTTKPVIWTGDLNVAHEDIDIHSPSTNHRSAGFTDEERSNFSKVLKHGWIDAFRTLHPTDPGWTYWGYRSNGRVNNKGWRLDYFVVSPALWNGRIVDVSVGSEINAQGERMSDHAPLILTMKI
jgi:exodeoxyribonuclease-3